MKLDKDIIKYGNELLLGKNHWYLDKTTDQDIEYEYVTEVQDIDKLLERYRPYIKVVK